MDPESKDSKEFRDRYTHKGETIAFLGVWDTVGALGAPFGTPLGWLINKFFQYQFHDIKLSSIIESAYHAVAIDERRWPFRPCLWELNEKHLEKNSRSQSKGGSHSMKKNGFRAFIRMSAAVIRIPAFPIAA